MLSSTWLWFLAKLAANLVLGPCQISAHVICNETQSYFFAHSSDCERVIDVSLSLELVILCPSSQLARKETVTCHLLPHQMLYKQSTWHTVGI